MSESSIEEIIQLAKMTGAFKPSDETISLTPTQLKSMLSTAVSVGASRVVAKFAAWSVERDNITVADIFAFMLALEEP